MSRNRFISVEGTEGAGKSTSLAFIQQWFEARQIVPVMTREPGGTPLAEEIREVLLARRDEQMSPDTELLLMYASRVQHCEALIKPAIAAGQWVISDRFNDASFAYQGAARELGEARLTALDDWCLAGFKPDYTLFLDVPIAVGMQRVGKRGNDHDRIEMESKAFFERVRQGYLSRAAAEPERFFIVDASQTIAAVEMQLATILESIVDD